MQYTKRTCGFYIFTSSKGLMSNAPQLVQKLWNYCHILRDDGLSSRLRMATTGRDGDYAK